MMQPHTITVYTRDDFRKWLEKHDSKEKIVSVIVHKRHTGKPAPKHRELLEEAICFGWIDTTLHRLDDDTYVRKFVKRNKNSRWSDNTLRYARDLIKRGLMTEEGMKYYELGKAKPTHDHGIPKNPDMPDELKEALAKDIKAQENFEKFPPSTKRMFYRWLLSAKLPTTRAKRITQIFNFASANNKNFLNPTTKANN
jgi:uncharacterized protein YdeI (YjbR/CyaY-like superfamily)